jgi:hypothetical protein
MNGIRSKLLRRSSSLTLQVTTNLSLNKVFYRLLCTSMIVILCFYLSIEYIPRLIRIKDNLSKSQSNFLLPLFSSNRDQNSFIRKTLNTVNNKKFVLKNNSNSIEILETCPLIPPELIGPFLVNIENESFKKIEKILPEIEIGGRFRPKECIARHKVAIIIPYRDREEHLKILLRNIHPMLERQQLDYGIYVVEQFGNSSFNRAKLMNIGFLESRKQYDYQCFIFHDVDLIPEDDRNLYTCSEQPRHMSVAIDKFGYKLFYEALFGGACALTEEQFLKVNGFSNVYFGWGGEDDDMYNRVINNGYNISRYSENIARYKMLRHKADVPNPDRFEKLYYAKRRYKYDGVNRTHYELKDLVLKKLFTWILVDVEEHSSTKSVVTDGVNSQTLGVS